jgi:MATE family multidrug resistance protein
MQRLSERPSLLLDGKIKGLLLLFFPILLMTFSNCLFLFIEKIFLGQLSSEAMTAAVSAAYACQVTQLPTVALAMMAQVCVGRWYGAQEWTSIGPGIWQFIWFSLLSMLITVPIGLLYERYYFHGTSIEAIVLPYYRTLLSINFLFPLAATLSCFFLGQGKTRLILVLTLISQGIKILFAYLFIFGWGNLIPAWGLLGGVFSTFLAQGGFCLVLLGVFLQPDFKKIYSSSNWTFKPKLFWECIQPGILRAMNRVLIITSWAAIAHLMTTKEEDYPLVLSVGGTLFLFLPFLGDATCQAQITVVSHLLGSKRYLELNRAFRSGLTIVSTTIILCGIPLVVFPLQTFDLLFSKVEMTPESIKNVFLGVWASFVFSTFACIPISYVLAFKDTNFSLFMGLMCWMIGYLFMYVAIEVFVIPADQFWSMLAITYAVNALLYQWRMKKLESALPMTASPHLEATP